MSIKPTDYSAFSCKSIVSLFCIRNLGKNSIILQYSMGVFSASNGKYWSVADNDMVMLDGDGPTPFIVEFKGNSKLTIKAPNGNLLKTEQNGLFKATGTEVNASTLLEF